MLNQKAEGSALALAPRFPSLTFCAHQATVLLSTLASTTDTQYTSRRKLKKMDGTKKCYWRECKSRKSILILSLGADANAAPVSVKKTLVPFRGRQKVSLDGFQIPTKVTMLQLRCEKPDENGCIKVECLVVFIWYVSSPFTGVCGGGQALATS